MTSDQHKTMRLMVQHLRIQDRQMGWGQISWTPQYLQVTPNHPSQDKNVAEFLLACVWFAKEGTG